MTKTILAFYNLAPYGLKDLENEFHVVRLWQEADPVAAIEHYNDRAVAIISWPSNPRISRQMIEALPHLEMIAQFGVGYDNIDVQAAKERHVLVCNTPDIVTNDTADTALALMLNVARRFVEADAYLRIGKWASDGPIGLGHRLGGKTVGIVGLGRIGQAIATRAEAFGCVIKYTGRTRKDEVAYDFIPSIKRLAEESDFLVLSCATNEDTKGIIDLDILKALGPSGYLINISRGSVVNEEDLQMALYNKYIAGAGLDVFEKEPFVPDALKMMDNVVLLPHIGTSTVETRTEMAKLVVGNILSWFRRGETLTRVV